MAEASKELINMLTEFLITELGSKAIDGITYTMLLKEDKEKETYRKYMNIRKETQKCGFGMDEVFRVYEVCNGYIFDMDISVAKRISYELAKAVNQTNGGQTPVKDFIADGPDKRRKSDMLSLAKYAKKQYDSGNQEIEVALFSRNTSPTIRLTGIGKNNELLALIYNAYAIRHWDIELINKKLLIPAGIRIARLEPCEVLPSKTGVRFKMAIEPMANYY